MTKEKIYPVYLLSGKDHREIKRRISQLEVSIFPDLKQKDNINSLMFFGEDCDMEEVLAECHTYPVFTDKKLIKVYDYGKLDKKNLENYIKSPSDTTVLILVSSTNDKEPDKTILSAMKEHGKVEYFKDKSPQEALAMITTKLKKAGVSYDPEVLNYLVEQEECSIGNMDRIVEAIETYCQDGGSLSVSDIPDILVSSKIPSIFDFIDTLFSGNLPKTLRLFQQMIVEEGNFGQCISMIYRQLKLIWQAKTYLNQGIHQSELAKRLNLPPFIAKKIAEQSSRFSIIKLEKLFHGLSDLDYQMKSGDNNLQTYQFEIYLSSFHGPST